MPVLRLALPADANALAILAERTFRDAFGARNSPGNMDLYCARAFGPEIQLREIGERDLVTTLADEGRQLVGFSQLRIGKASPAVKAKRPQPAPRPAPWSAEVEGGCVVHVRWRRPGPDLVRALKLALKLAQEEQRRGAEDEAA